MTAAVAASGQPDRDLRWLRRLWWIALLLVLGPLWLVQRDLWDGVIGSYGLERQNFDGIHAWLVPSNWGLMYLIFRGVGWLTQILPLPHWVWIKLLLCASVVGISLESRRLCSDVLGWDARSCQAVQLLVLAFPCWYLLYGSTFVYVVFIWWVLLAHRWLHSESRWRQLAGFGLLLASYQVNSNFVMVFALEAARWICREPGRRWSWPRSALIAGSAIAVYLTLRLAFPPRGVYQGYNNLVSPFNAAGLTAWLRAGLMFATWLPLIVAPAGLAWLLVRGTPPVPVAPSRSRMLAVAILFAGALFAYLAVGKGAPLFVVNLPLAWLGSGAHLGREATQWIYTTVDGWSTRHTFLLSLPAAIATVGLIGYASRAATAAASRRAWWAAIGLALVTDLAWTLHGHAAKLQRIAQEETIIAALKAHGPPPPGRVDLQIAPAPGWSVWTYEANYWTWRAWGSSLWAVAAYPAGSPSAAEAALKEREAAVAAVDRRDYNLMHGFQPTGCRTVWRIQLPPGLTAASLLRTRSGLADPPAATVTVLSQHCAPLEPAKPG